MSLSRRLRFEILRRDNHTCRYCGAKAPDVALAVDHVIPQTLGGNDDPTNLVTACVDCNQGKASVPADAHLVADVNAFALRWATAMRQAAEQQQVNRDADDELCRVFLDLWTSFDKDQRWLPADWSASVTKWVHGGLTRDDFAYVVDAAVFSRVTSTQLFRYLAGVVRNVLTDRASLARKIIDQEPT